MFKNLTQIPQKIVSLPQSLQMNMSTSSFPIKLIKRTKLNHDSYMFRFELGKEVNPYDYKPGSHYIITGLQDNYSTFKNKYTPMQSYEGLNYFDTLIKIYRPNVNPQYPDGGKLTPLLENLKEGQNVNILGPLISIHYQGQGKFNIKRFKQKIDPDTTQVIEPNHVLFIAGGTGIAPFYSMMQEVVRERNQSMKITLLFGNKTRKDIVLKEELDNFAKLNKNIKIVYVINSADEQEWDGEVGLINKDMVSKYAGNPKDGNNYVMICGNSGMNKSCLKIVNDIGFDPYHYFRF